MRSMVLAALFIIGALSGCVDDGADGDDEVKENPAFSATFRDPPTWTYNSLVTDFVVDIKNVQPLKDGERVPEGGTHQVCLEVDGEIPDAPDGRPACELVGLAAGEEERFIYGLAPLPAGSYNVTVRGASADLEVRETPGMGETIEGTLANITIHGAHEGEAGWEWDVEVLWTDETAATLMEEAHQEDPDRDVVDWPAIVMMTVGHSGGGVYIGYEGNPTRTTVDSDGGRDLAPVGGEPVGISVMPDHSDLEHHTEGGPGVVDRGLFTWCCAV